MKLKLDKKKGEALPIATPPEEDPQEVGENDFSGLFDDDETPVVNQDETEESSFDDDFSSPDDLLSGLDSLQDDATIFDKDDNDDNNIDAKPLENIDEDEDFNFDLPEIEDRPPGRF